jgi:hypothetical protein
MSISHVSKTAEGRTASKADVGADYDRRVNPTASFRLPRFAQCTFNDFPCLFGITALLSARE